MFFCHCRGTTKTSWANGLLEQNKQTNQLFLYVQKITDNCYLIRVDNKTSIFIPEQRKNRLHHRLNNNLNNASVKITNGLVPKERICGVTSFTNYEIYTGILLCRRRSLSLSFRFCSRHRSSRHHVTLSELLKICQKLQCRKRKQL